MKKNTKEITRAAIIAALYVLLTFLSNLFGLASGAVQLRLSEALIAICLFTPAGIYGTTIGCFLSNLLFGCTLPDIIFGSLATLLGALGTYFIGKKFKIPALLAPVISNTLIIPFILHFSYNLSPIAVFFATVGIGELLSCFILGIPVFKIIQKNRNALGL